ncbi:MAG: hypothetical protein IJT07_02590 [Oscillospiraceae bacterium]|nr:hypothetical protein [Oscillospiraceae bacterium]
MAKKIRLLLEFGCYPVWLYDKNRIIGTRLPEELRSDEELDAKFMDLQKRFERRYYDKNGEFDPDNDNDWTKEEEQAFIHDFRSAVEELVAKTKARYVGDVGYEHPDIEEILADPHPYVIVDDTFAAVSKPLDD